ncbi:hypothetical protein [Pseudomonas tohonis]|uniref:hypothetical protein n=1 Tax=Pseudomonas tohonis TaxID=2725477 RepID=UPI001F22EE25|nr:hypothetical protein [Pseudomonas tohonis]
MTASSRRRLCSREQVLLDHAQQMVTRAIPETTFATRLNKVIHQQMGSRAVLKKVPNLDAIADDDGKEYLKQTATWWKRVRRWITAEIEFPCWLEEAWVAALEPEYRERCLNELSNRYGLLAVRDDVSGDCPMTAFGELVSRMGGAVEACTVVLADGVVDETDLEHLPAMVDSLLAMESRACELRVAAQRVLAEQRAHRDVSPRGGGHDS